MLHAIHNFRNLEIFSAYCISILYTVCSGDDFSSDHFSRVHLKIILYLHQVPGRQMKNGQTLTIP